MEFEKTALADAVLVKPRIFGDHRGFFIESYREDLFRENGITDAFVQDNHSRSSSSGVLRGLHFQTPPHAQAKLVRVARGSIYDVIVDIRVGSPTFGCWQGFTLTDENLHVLYVPVGFAHGFCTLSDITDVVYKAADYYSPDHDGGIVWKDPELGIDWPVDEPVLSAKDSALPPLGQVESPFTYQP